MAAERDTQAGVNPLDALSPYEVSHLIEHLLLCGKRIQLDKLLGLETASGRNAWFERKVSSSGLPAYGAELRRVVSTLDNGRHGPRGSRLKHLLNRQSRYVLMLSSANGLTVNLSPSLLGLIVSTRLWTARQAVHYGKGLATTEARLHALAGILGAIPDDEEELAAELISSIEVESPKDRTQFLKFLADCRAVDPLTPGVWIQCRRLLHQLD